MKREDNHCPECGTQWAAWMTCQDHFHQMLFWESENPRNGEVHHLTVLSYHLQHPSLYSMEGLRYAEQLLVKFLDEGISPQTIRIQSRTEVDSRSRSWNVTRTSTSTGAYQHPIHWSMTARDVVAGGEAHYRLNVRAWAEAILKDLRQSGNVAPE